MASFFACFASFFACLASFFACFASFSSFFQLLCALLQPVLLVRPCQARLEVVGPLLIFVPRRRQALLLVLLCALIFALLGIVDLLLGLEYAVHSVALALCSSCIVLQQFGIAVLVHIVFVELLG